MGYLSYLSQFVIRPSSKSKGHVLGVPPTPSSSLPVLGESEKQALMFRSLIKGLKSGIYKNIVVMCGAGISVSAGIPDFRSRAGLYKLECLYSLPHPMAVFSIDYFKENPRPFYHIIRKMILKPEYTQEDDIAEGTTAVGGVAGAALPEGGGDGDDFAFQTYRPTRAHCFFKLLHKKGLLRRVYTQNVDCLERVIGLDHTKELVQVHGTIASSHCSNCGKQHTVEEVYGTLAETGGRSSSPPRPAPSEVPRCVHSSACNGALKPDVTFFGEDIPKRLFTCAAVDFPVCDLLLCMGSAFQVMPFANYLSAASALTPRVLFNLEPSQGFSFDDPANYRDVFLKGNCDDTIQSLCDEVGWGDELREIYAASQAADSPTMGYTLLKEWERQARCHDQRSVGVGSKGPSSWWSWFRGQDRSPRQEQ